MHSMRNEIPYLRKTSPWKKFFKISLMVLIIALPAVFMTLKVMNAPTIECEVCKRYEGKEKCRRASGPDKKSCIQTAGNNACAFISSGMTGSIACGNTSPLSVKFFQE